MAAPTAGDVASFIGQGNDVTAVALAGETLPIVTAMVMAYTRGAGFTPDPAEDIAAVITTATARMMQNPSQLGYSIGEVTIQGGFTGWTLAEQFVLNRYRKRAA